jgi:hypothetical protein
MNADALLARLDALRAGLATGLDALPAAPWALPAAAVLVGIAAAALAALLLRRRPEAAPVAGFAALDLRVRALAAEGAQPAEIARRTGLPRDAVGMMLRVPERRQNSPSAAASAGARRATGPAPERRALLQERVNKGLAGMAARRREPARALPLSMPNPGTGAEAA